MFHINHTYSFLFEVWGFFWGGGCHRIIQNLVPKKPLFANLRNSNPWGCEEEVCKTSILSSLLLQCNITKKIFTCYQKEQLLLNSKFYM